MEPVFHAITLWSATAAACLVAASWQGLALAASIALCLHLLPGLSAAGRSRLWMGALLLVVLLHLAPVTLPNHLPSTLDHDNAFRINPFWGCLLTGAWAILSLLRLTQLARGVGRLRRIAQRAVPVTCSTMNAALLRSGRRAVVLCTSLDVDRPSVIGFRSPRILVPPTLLAELSACDLEQVILHELEHLRRADDWTNLLQKIVLALFPLNPALVWIERCLCTERELACDDGVLGQTHARKAYAICLTRLAEHSLISRGAALALNAWERQSELSRRVYRILLQPEVGARSQPARLGISLLSLALLAGASGLARCPRLVRFAPASVQSAGMATESVMPRSFAVAGAHLRLARMMMPAAEAAARPPAHAVRSFLALPAHRGTVHRQTRTRTIVRTARAAWGSAPTAAPTPWIVLTRFRQSNSAAGLRSAVDNNFSPSYAAVPFANGWLILEL